MRPRSSWLPRPLVVACLAAALLMLSDGLPVVHATIPYYPYRVPHRVRWTRLQRERARGEPGPALLGPQERSLVLVRPGSQSSLGHVGGHSDAGRLQW